MKRSVDQAANDAAARPGTRLLSRAEVLDKVGISYPAIWKRMRQGTFPRSVCVGEKVFWIESEIDSWIADLPRRRLKGHDDGVPYHHKRKASVGRAA